MKHSYTDGLQPIATVALQHFITPRKLICNAQSTAS